MVRLADYIDQSPAGEAPSTPTTTAGGVVEYDSQQPVGETVKQMVREVVAPSKPDYESAAEMDELFAQAEAMDAPGEIIPKGRISAAFDSGARLSMPQPKDEPLDPALKRGAARSRKAPPGGRPAGSQEFTDLFAAGMIVLIAFTLGEDFQPTEDEAKDLARPLGNILARRIDLAKKLGQDANDVVAFAIALMAYSVRVGPVAADRVRESYRDRQSRTRTDRVTRPPNSGGTDSVVTGPDDGASAIHGTPRHPLTSLAEARDAQFRYLDRDIGAAANGGVSVAADGSN